MEVAVGNMNEFGLLLVLVLAFSAPLIQNIVGKRLRREEEEENN